MFMTPPVTEMMPGVVMALLAGVSPADRVGGPLWPVLGQELAFLAVDQELVFEDQLQVGKVACRRNRRWRIRARGRWIQ
jgi:hypothetical protein